MKNILTKYKHAWVFLYFPIYCIWFFGLETRNTDFFHVIEVRLDSFIPFVEWFAIPYYLWYALVFGTALYLFFFDVKAFYRTMAFLCIGMTICLITYTVYPCIQFLRPDLSLIDRDNIGMWLVRLMYDMDTPTNICPSIHAFNSIGCCIGLYHSERFRNSRFYKPIFAFCVTLAISIVLSTMFIKQHSAYDVLWAIILSVVMYCVVYVANYKGVHAPTVNRRHVEWHEK